jgi:hypothetical protein
MENNIYNKIQIKSMEKKKNNNNNIILTFLMLIFTFFILSSNVHGFGNYDNPEKLNLSTSKDFIIFSKVGITGDGLSTYGGNLGTIQSQTSISAVTCPQITGRMYTIGTPSNPVGCVTTSGTLQEDSDKLLLARDHFDSAYQNGTDSLNYPADETQGASALNGIYGRGVYKFTGAVTNGDTITLKGNKTDIFIFQISGAYTQVTAGKIELRNNSGVLNGDDSPNVNNIFWLINGAVTIGTNTDFKGNTLTTGAVTLGANTNIEGRYLTDGQVTTDNNDFFIEGELVIIEEESEILLVQRNIIKSYSPINTTENKLVKFDLILNERATCDYYLDGTLTYTFNNIVSVSFTELVESGNHTYFYYCSKIENNTELFEISNTTSFKVELPITELVFQIEGNDFNVNDETLYVSTPCPVKGYSAIGYAVGYQPKYNPEGIKWRKVENGIAVLNMTTENHEFCLFNGRVIVNELNKTIDYNVQSKEGLLNLGNFTIPNSNYQVYKLNVDTFEIYDIYSPEAYGSSWASFISAFILFFLGGLIMYAGIQSQSKVAVLIGGTLLLGAFGLTAGGVISLIQF